MLAINLAGFFSRPDLLLLLIIYQIGIPSLQSILLQGYEVCLFIAKFDKVGRSFFLVGQHFFYSYIVWPIFYMINLIKTWFGRFPFLYLIFGLFSGFLLFKNLAALLSHKCRNLHLLFPSSLAVSPCWPKLVSADSP